MIGHDNPEAVVGSEDVRPFNLMHALVPVCGVCFGLPTRALEKV